MQLQTLQAVSTEHARSETPPHFALKILDSVDKNGISIFCWRSGLVESHLQASVWPVIVFIVGVWFSLPEAPGKMAKRRAEALYDFNPTADVELKIEVATSRCLLDLYGLAVVLCIIPVL